MKAYTYYILFLFLLIPAIQIAGHEPANNKRFTVVIDAGHGGHDPGAIGRRGKEKNINLSVALKLGRLIERNCSDTRVVYTRSTDKFVALHERAEIANNAKANLFISIHTNSLASRTTKVSGTETYTLGLHKTQENLEVAKKENSVILIESDYKNNTPDLTLTLLKAISYSNSFKTNTCRRALVSPKAYNNSSDKRHIVRIKEFTKQDSWC